MTFFRTHCRHKWTYTENKTKRQCKTCNVKQRPHEFRGVVHWRSYQG